MNALECFRAGKLAEAIAAANEEVRAAPDDARRRTFLFELLCFAGEYARAEKQLAVLALAGQPAALGTMMYRAALQAEQRRNEFFDHKQYLSQPPAPGAVPGSVNGAPCAPLTDADPRLGPRLEVFLGGDYVWIPFAHLRSLEMEPPRRLRDLLWSRALLKTGPGFPLRDLGEVFVPVLSPLSWKHSADAARLGRETAWELDHDGQQVPFGQKLWLVDDREVPFLELRKVEFHSAAAAASGQ